MTNQSQRKAWEQPRILKDQVYKHIYLINGEPVPDSNSQMNNNFSFGTLPGWIAQANRMCDYVWCLKIESEITRLKTGYW